MTKPGTVLEALELAVLRTVRASSSASKLRVVAEYDYQAEDWRVIAGNVGRLVELARAVAGRQQDEVDRLTALLLEPAPAA